MKLFNFLKNKSIDFSNEKIIRLSSLTDSLGDVLIRSGFGFYVDHLSQIRLAAEKHDEGAFKKIVISRELFGGAGAIWEISIEDEAKRKEFKKKFCDFIDHLKSMGVKNRRINQVRSYFK